jgi:uncharacterized membrane protein YfcA
VDAGTAAGTLAVGLVAGVLSGMFGVGGAVVSTPGIRALGVEPIMAVGSTIPAILPGALTGAYRYAREGLVDWRIGLVCGATGALFAFGGAEVSDVVDARWLMVVTACLLAWSGLSIIRKARVAPSPAGAATSPGPGAEVRRVATPALTAVGAVSGFVAGLLGVGGGVVMMPVFTTLLRIPVKVAVASSLVAVAIFSVPAMANHARLGHIDWEVALLLVVGTVPGARLGARLTIGNSERTVQVLLGAFLLTVALIYGVAELVAIAGDG